MSIFHFKYFNLIQENSPLKFGTDAMLLGAFARINDKTIAQNGVNILDIGTGNGAIALMQAQLHPKANITGIEINPIAFREAKLNCLNAPFSSPIKVFLGDFLTTTFASSFDLIVTNPPYYNTKMLSKNESLNQAKHESHLPFNLLFEKIKKILSPKGCFWIIIPQTRTEKLVKLASSFSLYLQQHIIIEGKPEQHIRDILVFSHHKVVNIPKKKLVIRNNYGHYTTDYKNLTREFHAP